MTGPKPERPLVLVLAGGGSRGAMEVGVLAVLAERGFTPDHAIGTSAGALNATMVAALPLPEAVARLIALWNSPEARAVFHASPRELVRNLAARRAWLRGSEPLRHLVRTALNDLGVRRFEDLRLPLSVLVTDFVAGRAEVLTEGGLEDALVASCSVPGIFPPVMLRRRRLVDGGVLENCSLSTAVALDPRRVVAVDVAGTGKPPAQLSFIAVVDRTMGLAQRARLLADMRIYSATTPISLICPRPSRQVGLLEPVDAVRLIELTATAVRAAPDLFDDADTPALGTHDILIDLSTLQAVRPSRRVPPSAMRRAAAERSARWTRALVRARREAAWIEIPDDQRRNDS